MTQQIENNKQVSKLLRDLNESYKNLLAKYSSIVESNDEKSNDSLGQLPEALTQMRLAVDGWKEFAASKPSKTIDCDISNLFSDLADLCVSIAKNTPLKENETIYNITSSLGAIMESAEFQPHKVNRIIEGFISNATEGNSQIMSSDAVSALHTLIARGVNRSVIEARTRAEMAQIALNEANKNVAKALELQGNLRRVLHDSAACMEIGDICYLPINDDRGKIVLEHIAQQDEAGLARVQRTFESNKSNPTINGVFESHKQEINKAIQKRGKELNRKENPGSLVLNPKDIIKFLGLAPNI